MSNNQYIYGNQNISGSLNIASGYTALIGNTTANSNLLYRGLILQGGYSTTVQRQQNLMTFGALGTSYIDPDPFNDTAVGNDRNWHIGSISDTDYFQSPRFSFINSGSERLTILQNNGNVGIGTNNPLSKFVISSGSSENIEFLPGNSTYNGGVLEYINRTSETTRPDFNFFLNSVGGGAFKFFTNGANERMRINSSGNVGIGTTNPTIKLDVQESTGTGNQLVGRFFAGTNTNGSAGGIALGSTQTTGGYIYGEQTAASSGDLVFGVQNLGSYVERMRILANGNIGIGTTTSSDRLTVSGSVTSIGQLNNTNGSFLIDHPGVNTWKIGITDLNTSTLSIGNDYGGTFSNKALNIINTGNIGIGTTVPSSSLDIKAASAYITLTETGLNRTGKLGYTDGANLRLENDSASNTYIGTYNNLFLSYNGGNTAIGKTSANSTLDVNGNTIISGSLNVSNGYNVIVNSTTASNEATMILGPPPAGGSSEGGQLTLQAPGGTYTSASMIDNYENQFRLLRGTNSNSDASLVNVNLQNGNFGIGKTPTVKLDVSGDTIISGSFSVSGSIKTVNSSNAIVTGWSGNITIGTDVITVVNGLITDFIQF